MIVRLRTKTTSFAERLIKGRGGCILGIHYNREYG